MQYTSYYQMGGRLVGMNRANYPAGTNGQLRIVGDHLGGTTLVLDSYSGQSGPNVVQEQFYKPYGEVARQTGQQQPKLWLTSV